MSLTMRATSIHVSFFFGINDVSENDTSSLFLDLTGPNPYLAFLFLLDFEMSDVKHGTFSL